MKENTYYRGYFVWIILLCIALFSILILTLIDYASIRKVSGTIEKIELNVMHGRDVKIKLKGIDIPFYEYTIESDYIDHIKQNKAGDQVSFLTGRQKVYLSIPFGPERRKTLVFNSIYESGNLLFLWLVNYHYNFYLFILTTIFFVGVLFNSTGLILVNNWKFRVCVILLTAFAGWCVNGLTWHAY